MNEEKLFEEIKTVISTVIEVDPAEIQWDTKFVEDLGVDSMLALEILVALEKKYGVKIPEERLADIKTLRDTVALAKEFVKL